MPYKLVDIKHTYAGRNSRQCPVGSLTNERHRYATLAIFSEGFSNSYIYLHHEVLRQALLSNPQFVESILGLKIYDLKNPETVLPKPPKPVAAGPSKRSIIDRAIEVK